jgi:coenzyme PQQ synthesis protein D (PqqD)
VEIQHHGRIPRRFLEQDWACDTEQTRMEIDFSQRLLVSDETLFRELGEESVLLSLGTDSYHGLDDVGTTMWKTLVAADSIHAAYAELLAGFDVEPTRLRSDLEEFVENLVSRKLARLEN